MLKISLRFAMWQVPHLIQIEKDLLYEAKCEVHLDNVEDILHVVPGMQFDDGDDLGELPEQVLTHVLITCTDHTQEGRHHLHIHIAHYHMCEDASFLKEICTENKKQKFAFEKHWPDT